MFLSFKHIESFDLLLAILESVLFYELFVIAKPPLGLGSNALARQALH